MRTPVALPPILHGMEQRMQKRRRIQRTETLENRQTQAVVRLRQQAAGHRRASSASALSAEPATGTASHINEWLSSAGLRTPNEAQSEASTPAIASLLIFDQADAAWVERDRHASQPRCFQGRFVFGVRWPSASRQSSSMERFWCGCIESSLRIEAAKEAMHCT